VPAVDGLSPGASYLMAVSAYKKDFYSAASTIMAQTSGDPLPVVSKVGKAGK
jgi:hypothetical protein